MWRLFNYSIMKLNFNIAKVTISVWPWTYVLGTIGFDGWRQVFSALTAVRHTFSWLRVELKSNLDFLNFVFDAVVFFWLFWNSATQQRHLNNSQFNNFSSSFSPRTIKQRTYLCWYLYLSFIIRFVFFFKIENTIFRIQLDSSDDYYSKGMTFSWK